MKQNSLLIMIYMEKRKEIQIENLQEQPIQSTLGLCYPMLSNLVLFSPLRFYSVVPKKKKKKKKVLFGPILFTSVLFSLICSTLVELSPLRSYSIPQVYLGLIWSTLVLFSLLSSYFVHFCPFSSVWSNSLYFKPFNLFLCIQENIGLGCEHLF